MAEYVIRRATADDIDELIRLRNVMFDAMGVPTDDHTWYPEFSKLIERGDRDHTVAAFVADIGDADGRLVGGGVGSIWPGPPGPGNPGGRRGYIYSMATDADWRRRGIARGVVTALLDWFVAAGVVAVDLHATAEGEPIYRSMGFAERSFPELSWRPPKEQR